MVAPGGKWTAFAALVHLDLILWEQTTQFSFPDAVKEDGKTNPEMTV